MITLKIATHDGLEYEALVEQYDEVALNAELNDGTINTVVIGKIIVSRINVKSVVPVDEEKA